MGQIILESPIYFFVFHLSTKIDKMAQCQYIYIHVSVSDKGLKGNFHTTRGTYNQKASNKIMEKICINLIQQVNCLSLLDHSHTEDI